jgi:TP901 family phage tail tape measure protein
MAIQPIKIIITGVDQLSSKLAGHQKRIQKFGNDVAKVGRTLTIGLTLPILAMGGAALKSTADFEQSMLKVGSVSGATGETLQKLERQARDLGASTQFSAGEAAQGMFYLAQAGFSTDEIMSAIPGTLDLATGAQMELGRASELTADILRGYQISAVETNRVVDLLANTANSTSTDVEGLAEAFKFIGPVAAGMKIPIEDTATAIGLLSNAGLKGAMAGTNLRGAISALIDPTREARGTLAKLGIPKEKLIDAQGNLKNLGDTIKAFEESGATTADMLSIFGQKVGPAFATLVSQGSKAYEKLNVDLKNSRGEARKTAAAYEDSFYGQLEQVKGALEELGISALKDTGILSMLSGGLKQLSAFITKISKVNPMFLKMGVIFMGILAIVGPLLAILGPIIAGIATVSAAIASAGGVVALLSNPIGWVIAGIVALVGIITFMATHLQSKATKMLTLFFPLGGVVAWIIARWERLLPFFKLIFFGIAAIIKTFAKIVYPIIKPIVDLLAFLGGLILTTLDKALGGLEKLSNLVLPDWVKKKIGLQPIGGAAPGGGAGAMALTERAGSIMNRNENTTNIKIENKANASVRTETTEGSVNLEVYRGLLAQGAF